MLDGLGRRIQVNRDDVLERCSASQLWDDMRFCSSIRRRPTISGQAYNAWDLVRI
jgi:hypothetical protein